jgi:hypothetical protein
VVNRQIYENVVIRTDLRRRVFEVDSKIKGIFDTSSKRMNLLLVLKIFTAGVEDYLLLVSNESLLLVSKKFTGSPSW